MSVANFIKYLEAEMAAPPPAVPKRTTPILVPVITTASCVADAMGSVNIALISANNVIIDKSADPEFAKEALKSGRDHLESAAAALNAAVLLLTLSLLMVTLVKLLLQVDQKIINLKRRRSKSHAGKIHNSSFSPPLCSIYLLNKKPIIKSNVVQ